MLGVQWVRLMKWISQNDDLNENALNNNSTLNDSNGTGSSTISINNELNNDAGIPNANDILNDCNASGMDGAKKKQRPVLMVLMVCGQLLKNRSKEIKRCNQLLLN